MQYIIARNIKTFIFKKLYLLFIYLIYSLFIITNIAKSDGWVLNKYEGLFIATINIQSFNSTTSVGEFDKNKRVLQTQYILYSEYGFTDSFTFGGKIIANDNFFTKNNIFFGKPTDRSFGLDGASIFGRYCLYQNRIMVLSLSQTIQTPSAYNENNVSYFGLKVWQYEPKIELGFNLGKDTFTTITFGWHGNIEHWYDEMRLDITFGHYIMHEMMFLINFQKYIYYIKDKDKANMNFNLTNIPIYDFFAKSGFAKITFSVILNLDFNAKLQLGVYTTIKSKFTKTENLNIELYGCFISFWLFFDAKKFFI